MDLENLYKTRYCISYLWMHKDYALKKIFFYLICMFDVIEHLQDYIECLLRVRESVTKDGVILILTPNKDRNRVSKEREIPENPFHLKEFTYKEFKSILDNFFSQVEIYFQETFIIKLPVFMPKRIIIFFKIKKLLNNSVIKETLKINKKLCYITIFKSIQPERFNTFIGICKK